MQQMKDAIQAIGFDLSEKQISKLYHFYQLVVEQNKVMNLTAITEYRDFIRKHYLDSLSIVLLNNKSSFDIFSLFASGQKVLDLGTGAGFPGIPLAIVFPDAEFTLLDSLKKRVRFLERAITELNLSNVTAIHGRAEEFARQSKYREQFDLCVSRAVANLSVLSEYALPFVKIGGTFISYKGADAKEEIEQASSAIKTVGGAINLIKTFTLPDPLSDSPDNASSPEPDRTLVVLKKEKHTPKKYPRRAGTPAKQPL